MHRFGFKYILVDREPVVEPDTMVWALWFEHADRKVARTKVGDVEVSTVFLGLDHNYGPDGPPLVFETMVFGGPLHQETRRYATWGEAVAGHDELVTLVKMEQQLT